MAAPAEPPPKLPSSASQYELIGQIGVGATSQVWAAKCTETQEDVAVKVIDLEHVNTNLEEIRNEIRVMSMSHHPNVVRYHCSFVNNSRYLWIVMPLMHGGSVMNIMQTDQKPLEEDIIAYVLLQVVHGIEYFHQSGHIHRDIKASNVLIDQMGHVYLGDFGVSAALQEAHNSESRELRQTFVGTPCWMAPEVMEQMSGYDQKADIWSFGVTIIEMAQGKAPYDGFDPLKVLLLTLKNPAPTLEGSSAASKFSPELHAVVNACLQKDPTLRPTASELLKMPFFITAAASAQVGPLVRILQSLPPLIERFKQIEARIVRSGVWSVSKNELTSALAGNTTTAEKPKVSWDFDTEPEQPNAPADLDSDEGEEDTLTQLLSKIPSEMLLERVPATIVRSVCNTEPPANSILSVSALEKMQGQGEDVMLQWVQFPTLDGAADRIAHTQRLRQIGSLNHPHIPTVRMCGIAKDTGAVVLICERLPATSVHSYLLNEAPMGVELVTAQCWCAQVLSAIVAMHACSPPLTHQDLSCHKIHLHSAGIGQAGVCAGTSPSTSKLGGMLLSLKSDEPVANGAFVPIEMYDDNHKATPKVDVYALGLCALQILTGQEPYAECDKAHHLFRKVSNGSPPDALKLVQDAAAREFVETCLLPLDARPAAADLLEHPFLQVRKVYVASSSIKKAKGSKVQISLTIAVNPKHKEIAFEFDTQKDTSLGIASEMVGSVPMLSKGGPTLREEIRSHIDRLIAESQAQGKATE